MQIVVVDVVDLKFELLTMYKQLLPFDLTEPK